MSAMGQQKNFIDQPYLEVSGKADTLITPDQIFLSISLSEKDTKDRVTVEQLEERMLNALQKLGINTDKNLKVIDVLSNYRDYLLKKKDILKSKRYELEVSTADTASKVLLELESIGISNVDVAKLDHTRRKLFEEEVQQRSVLDARKKAVGMASALNQKVGSAIHVVEVEGVNRPHVQGELSEVVVSGFSGRAAGIQLNRASDVEAKDISFRQIKLEKTVIVRFILQ
jgi:uncharacterized protein